jgi:hypothetical protein
LLLLLLLLLVVLVLLLMVVAWGARLVVALATRPREPRSPHDVLQDATAILYNKNNIMNEDDEEEKDRISILRVLLCTIPVCATDTYMSTVYSTLLHTLPLSLSFSLSIYIYVSHVPSATSSRFSTSWAPRNATSSLSRNRPCSASPFSTSLWILVTSRLASCTCV